MPSLPSLKIGLALDSATFQREVRAVGASVDRLGSRVNRQTTLMQRGFTAATGAVRLFAAGIATAGVAGLGRFVSQSIAAADAIGKTADKIGVSVEALQELRFAAERTGASQGALDTALQRFARRTGEAAQGAGELLKVVEQYDIELRNLDGTMRPVVSILKDYADIVAGAESPQEQLRLAVKAFDTEGAVLVNLLREGAAGIDTLSARARELGGVLDRDATDKAAAAADALTDLSAATGTLATQMAVSLAPAITTGADALTTLITNTREAQEALTSLSGVSTGLPGLDFLLAAPGAFERLVTEFAGSDAVATSSAGEFADSLDALRARAQAVPAALAPVAAAIGETGEAGTGAAVEIAELAGAQKRLAEAGAILLRTSALEERFDADREAAQKLATQQEALLAQEEQMRQQRERQAAETERLLARPFENFLQSIQSSTTDTFETIYSGGVKSFSDLFDEAKRLATRFAAELTSLALFNPQAVLGLANATGGSPALSAGGGGVSLFSRLFGGAGASTGRDPGGGPGGMIPPTTSFNFSGAIGGGIAGFGVGTGVGSSIGGEEEAAIGSAVGTAVGAAIGAYFANPALGAFLGGTVGGIAGGLLGGGASGPDSTRGSAGGVLGGASVTGSNVGEFGGFLREFDRELLSLLNARQEKIADQALRRAGSIDRSFIGFTPDVALSIAQERVRPVARSLGLDPRSITNAGSPTGILSNLQTALETQRAIEDLTGAVSTFDRQAEDLENTFGDLERSAERFKISTDGLAEAQAKAARDLGKAQDAAIGALLDPFQALIQPLEDFQEQLRFGGLTPGGQLEAARSDFRRLTEEALGGSIPALEALAGAGQLFIATAEQFGASPAEVAARAEVAAAVADALTVTTDAQTAASRGVEEEIARHRKAEIDKLDELLEEVRNAVAEIKRKRV